MSANILFNSLDGDSLSVLIDVMVKKEFSDGEDIITQGAQGDFYYVLQEGTCDIFKDGKLVLQCSKGMGFGELVRVCCVLGCFFFLQQSTVLLLLLWYSVPLRPVPTHVHALPTPLGTDPTHAGWVLWVG